MCLTHDSATERRDCTIKSSKFPPAKTRIEEVTTDAGVVALC